MSTITGQAAVQPDLQDILDRYPDAGRDALIPTPRAFPSCRETVAAVVPAGGAFSGLRGFPAER